MGHDGCGRCRDARELDIVFSFAFQPIFDIRALAPFAYEALARGPNGEPAASVLAQVDDSNRYAFDQAARVRAVELAAALMPGDSGPLLSVNIMPNAVYDPLRCLRTTLEAARRTSFPHARLMFEATEHERIVDTGRLRKIVRHYSAVGFTTALDDFGSGYAGLSLLIDLKPHILKLDRALVRDIDTDSRRKSIVAAIIRLARELEIEIIGEGVETVGEFNVLADLGVKLFQGYLFARPAFEQLPEITEEAAEAVRAHRERRGCGKVVSIPTGASLGPSPLTA